jgi:hypothetical protein
MSGPGLAEDAVMESKSQNIRAEANSGERKKEDQTMFNHKVLGSFDQLEKAKVSVDALTNAELHVPPSSVTVGTNIINRYAYKDEGSLTRLFSCWIILGAVVGVMYTYQFSQITGFGSLLSAALAYGAFGAAAGQLVAGLFDVIFSGSLDDRPNIEDATAFTVTATVPELKKSEVEKVMTAHGANAVFNVAMPAK